MKISDDQLIELIKKDADTYFPRLLNRYKRLCYFYAKEYYYEFYGKVMCTLHELYINAMECVYFAARHYKKGRKASFHTYLSRTIEKELLRFCEEFTLNPRGGLSFCSLDAKSYDTGLLYEEVIGENDPYLEHIFIDDEISDVLKEENQTKKPNYYTEERLRIIMCELSGEQEYDQKEITKLRRRIKYHLKKNRKKDESNRS